MDYSLKTKISTPLIDESIEFYTRLFGMRMVEEWDERNDRGAILSFSDGRDEAFLEIYFDKNAYDFSGLSLQFRTENLAKFIAKLPPEIQYEGPTPRPWGSTYLYLQDPNDISVIVYEGGN
tara:strand:- start:329 stop:691 length:363 start_codon:yes stop_codon:yes gene_type:complete